MRENSKRTLLCVLAGAIVSFCALPVSAEEKWNCDRISGLAKAFTDPDKYLAFGWIRFAGDLPKSVLAHCVDTGVLGSNGQDDEGWSVLHHAILGNFGERNLPIITALLRAGADPSARTKRGATPLHIAAFTRDDLSLVKELLMAGADVNARDEDGATPLHSAASSASPNVIAELLKAGAEVNARTTRGLTPLHAVAMAAKDPETVVILLDAGADPELETLAGITAFEFAAKNEAIKMTDVYWRLNDGRF